MMRSEAIERATRLVMGARLDEYVEAARARAAGEMATEIFEPIKHGFDRVLERRRDQIARTALELMNPPAPAQCAASIKGARCTGGATTTIDGRGFCATHAALVPRKEIPAGRGAA